MSPIVVGTFWLLLCSCFFWHSSAARARSFSFSVRRMDWAQPVAAAIARPSSVGEDRQIGGVQTVHHISRPCSTRRYIQLTWIDHDGAMPILHSSEQRSVKLEPFLFFTLLVATFRLEDSLSALSSHLPCVGAFYMLSSSQQMPNP